MMQNSSESTSAFEYDSPVEFILVASLSGSRAIVARSKGSKMDLAYYSHFNHIDYESAKSASIDMFYPAVDNLIPLSVNSRPVSNPRRAHFDDRESSFTFVWRGVKNHQLAKDIQTILDDAAPLLVESFEYGSGRDTEWLLSPIVAKCSESLATSRRRRLIKAARLKVMVAAVSAYTLVAAAAYFFMFILKK